MTQTQQHKRNNKGDNKQISRIFIVRNALLRFDSTTHAAPSPRGSNESCITNISSIIELRSLTSKSIRSKRKMTGNMARWRGGGTTALMCCLNTAVSNQPLCIDNKLRSYLRHFIWPEIQSSTRKTSLANVPRKMPNIATVETHRSHVRVESFFCFLCL